MQKIPDDLKHLSPQESFKELRIRKDNFLKKKGGKKPPFKDTNNLSKKR